MGRNDVDARIDSEPGIKNGGHFRTDPRHFSRERIFKELFPSNPPDKAAPGPPGVGKMTGCVDDPDDDGPKDQSLQKEGENARRVIFAGALCV